MERRLIDDLAARDVDQDRVVLGPGDLARADEAHGQAGQRHRNYDDVGPSQHRLEIPCRADEVNRTGETDAPVDFIDKFASPEEVVLRLRRLIGAAPETLKIGADYVVDVQKRIVFGVVDGRQEPIRQIQGMKFEILVELASSWYRSPGELVPYWKLERFSEGDDSRASLRVRIREIKDVLGEATGKHLGPDDLIVSVRGRGYTLVPPRD